MKDCLCAAGGNYGTGFNDLMALPISECLMNLEIWAELKREQNPQPDKHAAAGFEGLDYGD